MVKNKFSSRKTILLLIDFALLFVSLFLALKMRSLWAHDSYYYSFALHFKPFLALFLLWLVIFYLFDFYDLKKIRSAAFNIYTLLGSLSVCLVLSVLFFYLISLFITPKTVLFLTGFIAFFLLGSWRYIWNQLFKTLNFKKKFAVVGAEAEKNKVLSEILKTGEFDYQLAGFIKLDQNEPSSIQNFPILGNYKNLSQIINQHKIDELVTAFDYHAHKEALREVSECLSSGIKITELPIFYEQVTSKVPVEHIDQIWFLYNLEEAGKRTHEIVKRAIDFVLSGLGLAFTITLFPFVALAIELSSPGPIFYSQKRVGKNGKIFTMHKFRTMIKNAEEKTGPAWAGQDDPRVTKVGKFLRRTRLDEIPQFWNVFKGEMSLVGPRPERPEFVKNLEKDIPFYSRRHIVCPGLSGWAQINYKYGSSVEDSLEKMQYDLYYIKNRTLPLYLMILLRTIRIILTRSGV